MKKLISVTSLVCLLLLAVFLLYPAQSLKAEEAKVSYGSFSGKVKEVRQMENGKYVLLEDNEGASFTFIVDEDTYFVTEETLEIGAELTGYYDMSLAAILIYPPQHHADVIVGTLPEGQNLKVDFFNGDMVSSDNMLKLNVSKETEIVSQNGEKYEGEPTNRRLAVLYGPSTKSIPAQAAAIKITVLYEKAVPPIHTLTDEDKVMLADVSEMDILVDGLKLDTQRAYKNETGVVMLPAADISRALGYQVIWDDAGKQLSIGKGIMLTMGQDYYVYMRTAPITLGTAPIIHNDRVYVPIDFFSKVMRGTADIVDGQIVISGENIAG